MSKHFEYTSKFGNKYTVEILKVVTHNPDDPRIRVELVSEIGEPIACATVQLEGLKTTEDSLIIKNYSENEGIYEWFRENDFIDKGVVLYLPPFNAECWKCTPTQKLRESWITR